MALLYVDRLSNICSQTLIPPLRNRPVYIKLVKVMLDWLLNASSCGDKDNVIVQQMPVSAG